MTTATKQGHTPGPWGWKFSQPAGIINIRSVGESIAHCYGPDRSENKPYFTERGAKTIFGADCERSEANARLIAAAPELLEALQSILFQAGCREARDLGNLNYDRLHAVEAQARAAIARATGQGGGE